MFNTKPVYYPLHLAIEALTGMALSMLPEQSG